MNIHEDHSSFIGLFEPVRIGRIMIKNRIAMAPMSTFGLYTSDGVYTQRLIDYYAERARGGVGLIITGAVKVENEIEKLRPSTLPNISLNPIEFSFRARELTDTVHTYDAKIFIQLTAGLGRNAIPHWLNAKPVAPSAIPNYWDPKIICRELTTEEIERLVKAFGYAAEVVVAAGFDGIEIHALHEGYLLDQFAISMWNRRIDKYGGELRDRLTLPIEILYAIKDKVGREFPVQLRFSVKSYVKDWRKGGLPNEIFEEAGRDVNEGLESARILEKAGYDAFNADAGSYEAWYWAHPPIYMPHGCYLDLTEKLKKVVNIPVLVAGRLGVPELAEKAIKEDKADIIALGRALIADPYWPIKVREGRIEDIRPCIGCHTDCLNKAISRPFSCAVNATAGREKLYELKPVRKAKNILIAGGGVAGMEAARVAAIRGHEVTLYEKSSSLGGHLIEASVPDFKKDIKRLLSWYKVQLKKTGVNIVLNTEVTPELVKNENPDALIIATGSTPILPKIPGIEKPINVTCTDLLLGKKKAGDNIVVLGGGLVGCETALWLAKQGKKVIIVEMLPNLLAADPPIPHMNRMMLIDLLALNKVKVLTNTSIHEITDESVVIIDTSFKSREIKCDTVVLALGLKSEDRLYRLLEGEVKQLYTVGDCKEPRRIADAIWDGYIVANTI